MKTIQEELMEKVITGKESQRYKESEIIKEEVAKYENVANIDPDTETDFDERIKKLTRVEKMALINIISVGWGIKEEADQLYLLLTMPLSSENDNRYSQIMALKEKATNLRRSQRSIMYNLVKLKLTLTIREEDKENAIETVDNISKIIETGIRG